MPTRPNIIFIMPDQLRPDFLSCYDAGFISTPHIDALGEHGITYGRAYSAHPVCVPARVSLIAGMNAIVTGALDNGGFLRSDYRACGLNTWPELLNQAGYYTIATGKMHFYPWEARLGFQRRIIAEDKIWIYIEDDYHHYLQAHGYRKTLGYENADYHKNRGAYISDIPLEHQVDHWVGQQSARWIREYEGDEPFAMMVGFPGPHHPYDPPPELASLFDPADMPEPIEAVPDDLRTLRGQRRGPSRPSWYTPKNRETTTRDQFMLHRAYYAALITEIDRQVGEIVEACREKGILDNTVIMLSSDHGDYLGDHGLEGKNSFYDAACRVPLLVRCPGAEGPTVSQDLVTLSDITATILRLAGCEIPPYMDSIPLPGLGYEIEAPRDQVVGMLTRGWMLHDGRYKLAKYDGGGSLLFDMENDPRELHNLATDSAHLDVLLRMETALTAEIMHAIDESHFDKRLYTSPSYSGDRDFGRVGWQREYPTRYGNTFPENKD